MKNFLRVNPGVCHYVDGIGGDSPKFGPFPSKISLLTGCFLMLLSMTANAQVTGVVFRDFNANGTRENTPTFNEVGVPGVTVTAFNSAGGSVMQTTAADGSYSFPNSGITAAGNQLRIEFTNLPSSDFSAPAGGSSVQFVTASATGVNFGINYPQDYLSNETPKVALPCYVGGSRQLPGNFGALDVFISYPWDNAGQVTAPSHDANYNTLGSVWATAFQRRSKSIRVVVV